MTIYFIDDNAYRPLPGLANEFSTLKLMQWIEKPKQAEADEESMDEESAIEVNIDTEYANLFLEMMDLFSERA